MKEQTIKYDNFSDDIRAMMGISQQDFDLIKFHTIFFTTYTGAFVEHIIKILSQHKQTRIVFEEGRGDTDRLEKSVTVWLVEVLDAKDSPETWQWQYRIGVEHIRRRIPNRHMMVLATKIREWVLPIMIQDLGTEEGIKLYLAFQRFLDTVIALTATLVDEGQRECLKRSTGFTDTLLLRLQEIVFDDIALELQGQVDTDSG